ncbi:MAG: hypothetical protein SXA11_01200 [Cyanobacteriota bacterium]|nr:hypothetical protein [Cyanobacteriota bacterium]
MDSMRQYLEEELRKDYEELKQLEDKLRYEEDPRFRGKWENGIRDIKQRISDREAEIESLPTQYLPLQSIEEICKPYDMNATLDEFKKKKISRLKRDITLVEKQSNELSEEIEAIVEEMNENRGDAVRQRNLNKKKKRAEEERNQYDREVEKLQAEVYRIISS